MLSIDQQTLEFAEIYQQYSQTNQITTEILQRLYQLLDKAYFITFGPFQTVVSDYLTAKCEHSPSQTQFNRTFNHFNALQNYPRAAGASLRAATKFLESAQNISTQFNQQLEDDILSNLKLAFNYAAKALSTANIVKFAEWGFSSEGKKFAQIQQIKDEIDSLKHFNNQEDADLNLRKIANLEMQLGQFDNLKVKSEGMRWEMNEIKSIYSSLKARLSLCDGVRGCCKTGIGRLQETNYLAPSVVVQLNYAQIMQALSSRGDIDMCMNLIVNCDVSPSLLIQNLVKYSVELLACIIENTEIPKSYKMSFLTSYQTRYVHKINLDFKCRKDLSQELNMALGSLFDVLVYCQEHQINNGTSTSIVFSGNPFTEYVCAAFILSKRFQCQIKILHMLVNISKDYFVQGILQNGITPCQELTLCGEMYEITQDIKDFLIQIEIVSGVQQGMYQMQIPSQQNQNKYQIFQKQQVPGTYRAPGAVSSLAKPGMGTFIQNNKEKLDLNDLTVQKNPNKKAVAFMPQK